MAKWSTLPLRSSAASRKAASKPAKPLRCDSSTARRSAAAKKAHRRKRDQRNMTPRAALP